MMMMILSLLYIRRSITPVMIRAPSSFFFFLSLILGDYRNGFDRTKNVR